MSTSRFGKRAPVEVAGVPAAPAGGLVPAMLPVALGAGEDDGPEAEGAPAASRGCGKGDPAKPRAGSSVRMMRSRWDARLMVGRLIVGVSAKGAAALASELPATPATDAVPVLGGVAGATPGCGCRTAEAMPAPATSRAAGGITIRSPGAVGVPKGWSTSGLLAAPNGVVVGFCPRAKAAPTPRLPLVAVGLGRPAVPSAVAPESVPAAGAPDTFDVVLAGAATQPAGPLEELPPDKGAVPGVIGDPRKGLGRNDGA